MARIGAEAAWTRTTGAGVRIVIVDTGVDLEHEDLGGKVVASASCVGSGGDPAKCQGSAQDDQGHGTHVSGGVALLLAQGYSPQAAVQRLLDSADRGVGCTVKSPTCRGLINLDRATAR